MRHDSDGVPDTLMLPDPACACNPPCGPFNSIEPEPVWAFTYPDSDLLRVDAVRTGANRCAMWESSETTLAAHFSQRCLENFLGSKGGEAARPCSTTERDEVEFSGLVLTNKALHHWGENTPREPGSMTSHISEAKSGVPLDFTKCCS